MRLGRLGRLGAAEESGAVPDSGPLLGADPAGVGPVYDDELSPPGEPSQWLYTVGPMGFFYWQLAAIAVGVVLLWTSESDSGRGYRRR